MDSPFVSVKPGTLLAPVPSVLVACGRPGEVPNLITIAWAGTVCSTPPMCSISVRPERYSHSILTETREFTLNLCDESMLPAMDTCGVLSGRNINKFEKTGLTPVKAEKMDAAPAVRESPLTFSCKIEQILPLGSHDMMISRIVAMGVRPDLMSDRGEINLQEASLIAYCHGLYHKLGEAAGFFGFSVAKPDVYARRMAQLRKSTSQ